MKQDVVQNTIGTKIVTMKYSEVFLTGCDSNTEWMLPWFFENYSKHNTTPIAVADFGMSEKGLEVAKSNSDLILDMTKFKGKGWFLKPMAMLAVPSKKIVWIDTDIEVRGDLSDILKHIEPEKLSMVIDHPWTNRRGELWHNSGVVAFQNKPMILRQWYQEIQNNPQRGDQETLHAMLNPITKMSYIKDLPHKYNVLRLDLIDNRVPKDIAAMHWTGQKGKDEIRRQMNA